MLLEALVADPMERRLYSSFYENDSSDITTDYLSAWLKERLGVLR